jgi:zinc transporter ZupT
MARQRVGLVVWLLGCVAVLVYGFAARSAVADSGQPEIDIVVAIAMTVLTFPLGIVVSVLIGELSRVAFESTGFVVRSGYLPMLLAWLAYLFVGALQWLVLWPAIARRLRVWRHAKRPSIE